MEKSINIHCTNFIDDITDFILKYVTVQCIVSYGTQFL